MKVTRALSLSVVGNTGKIEHARYTSLKFVKHAQHWVIKLFYSPASVKHSTAGMGKLSNDAKHKARGIVAAAKAVSGKKSCPQIKFTSCIARIESSRNSSFDYWVSFEDQFSKNRIQVPAKSHKRLNHFLRNGWRLNPSCELVLQKNGRWQVRVFVQKDIERALLRSASLGCDVGILHSVSRADGYLGRSARRIILRAKLKNAARQRQGHRRTRSKSSLRQQLDIEARRAVGRSKALGRNLVVESPKVLANLRPKGLT